MWMGGLIGPMVSLVICLADLDVCTDEVGMDIRAILPKLNPEHMILSTSDILISVRAALTEIKISGGRIHSGCGYFH